MAVPPPLVFAANRRALGRTAAIASGFSLVCALFTGLSLNQSQPRFLDWVAGSLLALYGSYVSYYYWTYLGRRQPALSADARGLYDNTAFSGWGWLPWTAIARIEPCCLSLKGGRREPAVGLVLAIPPRLPRQQRWRQRAIWLWWRWPEQPWPVTILRRDLAVPGELDLAAALRAQAIAAGANHLGNPDQLSALPEPPDVSQSGQTSPDQP